MVAGGVAGAVELETETPVSAAARPAGEHPGIDPRLRTRRWIGGGLVVAAVVVAAGFSWGRPALAARDRSHVRVSTEPAPLACTGTTVEERTMSEPVFGEDEPLLPVALVTADMRCTYTFEISNGGSRSVRLQRLSFPVLGPEAGPAIEAVSLEGPGTHGSMAPRRTSFPYSAVDADFDLGIDLAPKAAVTYRLVVVQRPDGCTPKGGGTSFPDIPHLAVRSFGVDGEVTAPGPGIGFLNTTDLNDCS